MQFPGLE